ncbi:CMP-N,N'-diacetyllegionaminic acid synthase [Domibacillus enclensis]|uniref:CMP-N,N'-diacetyllegionaminic acid synthase n=1 Tax=Domibacillus enclensis TaxID=1017273 RepID=A0A1N6SC42_9BACI|nr:CMP-N,N'-diacetyllegionaminic acid synthase [Domibacillus enclensis]
MENKNIRLLLEKPLIAHTINQAKETGLFDHIAVSSDSEEILKVAEEFGASLIIKRPAELATDYAAKLPVIQHCMQNAEEMTAKRFDYILDMDATSPLRSIEDIMKSMAYLECNEKASNLITGAPARRSPYFNLVEINESGYVDLSKKIDHKIIRRQDSPKCYDMNASIYIWKREALINSNSIFQDKTILFEMPEERSVDIDSELDFEFVSFLAGKRGILL